MTMQIRRRHRSSGELDVFGATSYFAGLPDHCRPSGPADRRLMIQFQANNQVKDGTKMEDEQLVGLHGDEGEGHTQLGVAIAKPSGNSKLAALLRIFMASPSQRASSFRKEPPPPSPRTNNKLPATAAGDEAAKASSSSSSSSRELHVIDLGMATGDRRLQGVRVVRGSGDGERWVVRCGAWDEEHHDHERMLDDAESSGGPKDDEVEEREDGNNPAGDWESDSSSDLFDLDLEYMY